MNITGYITRNLTALITAAALLCMPLFSAAASYQDADDGGKTITKTTEENIELVEEKAPRNSAATDETSVDSKSFGAFNESPKAEEGGFFYLTERDTKGLTLSVAPASSNALALDSILNSHSKKSLSSKELNYFNTQGAIEFTIADGDSHDAALDGFALSLKSAMNLGMPELAISPESVGMENPLLERRYNLGLSFGYSGFNIDANWVEKDGGVTDVYTGIDIGFSYRTQRWMTRVGLSEYTYARSPYSMLPEAIRNLHSFELGGAYTVSPWVSLAGGLKVTTGYENVYELTNPAWNSQVYLGGRLSY